MKTSLFQDYLKRAPLAVCDNANQQFKAIPASIQPMVLDDNVWKDLQIDAHRILQALEKAAFWLTDGDASGLAQTLFAQLSPIEKTAAFRRQKTSGFATARLDLFFDGDELKVIEVNTTIPAMQAYSDIIKDSYLRASLDTEVELKQSNSRDLLFSLLEHYQKAGGKRDKPRIAIVSRPGDSQMAELLWYQKFWQNLGYETLLGTPEQVQWKESQLMLNKVPVDLIYRHIFAYRLDPQSDFARACLATHESKIFNPISAHLEAKGVLAELSRIAEDPLLAKSILLTDEERAAVQGRVLWTRVLRMGPTISPAQEPIKDLASWVKTQQKSLIVKSSLGYGGRNVFFGEDFDSTATQKRLQDVLSLTHGLSWAEFVDFCVHKQSGQWIVQKKIDGKRIDNSYLSGDTVLRQSTFVDCSIFTNSGISFKSSGGACRFSSDVIVNIGQGGGLMPLFTQSELELYLPTHKP